MFMVQTMSCGDPDQQLIDMEVEKILKEKQTQPTIMESRYPRGSSELEDSLVEWRDKYERLLESHKRVEKVNQSLEEKLLGLSDSYVAERGQWTSDVAKLSVSLADANYLISNLRREIDRYKSDMGVAIQLLRCNSDTFSTPRITSLPKNVQLKLAAATSKMGSDSESLVGRRSTSCLASPDGHSNVKYRVLPASESPPPGVCPFPPTAMVHSMRGVDEKLDPNQITFGLMAKYLEEEILAGERISLKSVQHCSTCHCKTAGITAPHFPKTSYTIGTQTTMPETDIQNLICPRCNSDLLLSSRFNPPVSNLGDKSRDKDMEFKGQTKELQGNTILGHRWLSDAGLANTSRKQSTDEASLLLKTPVVSDPIIPNHGVIAEQDGAANSFSNALIKNIKMSQHMRKSLNRPRLCAIRFSSEGAATTNILLENANTRHSTCDTVSIVGRDHEDNLPPIEKQVYTKRSKYLDEELNDTKEVIVCIDKSAIGGMGTVDPIDSPGRPSRTLIDNNKTDSEKYREAHSSIENENILLGATVVVETVKGNDQSVFLMDDPVPIVKSLHVMDTTTVTVTGHQTVINNNGHNNNSLCQERLDRVAVWVQQNNEQKQQHLQAKPTGLLSRECNLADLSGSNASQLTVAPFRRFSGDVCIDIDDGKAAVTATTNNTRDNDINNVAQMEYNVKQFLLKQNEWSIVGGPGAVPLPEQVNVGFIRNMYASSPSMSCTSLPNQNNASLRTETKL